MEDQQVSEEQQVLDVLADNPRRFRHVLGFTDQTLYVEIWRDSRYRIVDSDGAGSPIFPGAHVDGPSFLDVALSRVRVGSWEEVHVEE